MKKKSALQIVLSLATLIATIFTIRVSSSFAFEAVDKVLDEQPKQYASDKDKRNLKIKKFGVTTYIILSYYAFISVISKMCNKITDKINNI